MVARSTRVARWQTQQTQLLSSGCMRGSVLTHGGEATVVSDTLSATQWRLLEEWLLALEREARVGALRWQHLRCLADLRRLRIGRGSRHLLLQELILEELLRLLLCRSSRVEEESLLARCARIRRVKPATLSVVLIHVFVFGVVFVFDVW